MQGLRERKKAATRQAISDVATRLFEAHGFEQVTMAEIAAAASVSVKTVFNYFGGKEELFFDHEDDVLQELVRAIRERPDGVSPTAAVRPLLLGGPILAGGDCPWSALDGELYEGIRVWLACQEASPALSARRLVITQSWAEPLGRAAGSEAWAAMLVGILILRERTLAAALFEQRAPRTVQRRVRAAVGEALDALERAFAPSVLSL